MNDTMYTLEEIAALRQKCAELQLEGREILEKYSDAELQKICNGIGPDSFSKTMRSLVTNLHPTLEVVAFIHDVEFEESDGTKESFTKSNDRYYTNGCISAKAEYAWYNPTRYVVIAQALRHSLTCQKFGWDGYKKQGDKNVESTF